MKIKSRVLASTYIQLVEGRELWLGGILLEHTKGLLGHSDADVLLHAVCDALVRGRRICVISAITFPIRLENFKKHR